MGRFATILGLLVSAGLLLTGPAREGLSFGQQSTGGGQAAAPAGEPLAIVVNRANAVDDLSLPELRRIFLGERIHWPDGRRITLVMREPGEPERRTMLREVCQMDESALKNHFLRGLFTGQILVSPKILASAVGVRKFVFNVPGAIGYLRLSDVDGTVKVIRIDEVFPDDKKYKLRVEAHSSN